MYKQPSQGSRATSPAYVDTSGGSSYVHPASFRGPSPLPSPANLRSCFEYKHVNCHENISTINFISSRTGCLSAAAKRYKFIRKLCHFQQMDFEYALWQMIYLFISPQKVYRNFHYRKSNLFYVYPVTWSLQLPSFCTGSKAQFARDDPAFLVLLAMWLCCKLILLL